jgi:AAA+ ATPase superfamily predicted ATPase
MKKYFLGRETELNTLETLNKKGGAHLIVIKGRRRIGKSRLAFEFAKNKKFYHFSGLAPVDQITAQHQRDEFATQLSKQFRLPTLKAEDWSSLFSFLAENTQLNEPMVILFDEISWMGNGDPTFLPKLKNAWDLSFSQHPYLSLILCGSISSWIETNILNSTAFFGRIALTLSLQELSMADSAKLLNKKGFKGAASELFKILSVTGGVPWYLEQINDKPAHDNIKRLCFEKESLLSQEFKHLFHDLFSKRSNLYGDIVRLLARGPKTFNDLNATLDREKSGALSNYLNDLSTAGFISRDYTWIIKAAKPSRLSYYRLSDNYLCFYFNAVEPKLPQIQTGKLNHMDLSTLPGFDGTMGLQFENLILNNRFKIYEKLHLKPDHVLADNPFFQRKTTTQPGCQIDYLIQTRFNTLFACEIKSSRHEIKADIIREMQEKLNRLALPKNYACFPVLIHINGVSDEVIDQNYFAEIIDFSEFLLPK